MCNLRFDNKSQNNSFTITVPKESFRNNKVNQSQQPDTVQFSFSDITKFKGTVTTNILHMCVLFSWPCD